MQLFKRQIGKCLKAAIRNGSKYPQHEPSSQFNKVTFDKALVTNTATEVFKCTYTDH